jgi:hypothetical protein
MTVRPPESRADAEALAAARVLLSRMGIDPADLLATVIDRPPLPTFAEYIPVVSGAVTVGTRRA